MRPRLTYSNATATLALFIALGGGAYAAVNSIPGREGVIHACYRKKGGGLRVLPAGKRCRAGERSLAWNQQGPEGIHGTNGTNGKNGTNGATNLVVRSITGPISAGGSSGVVVSCNPGEVATGGGASVPAFITGPYVLNLSEPTTNGAASANGEIPNGWASSIENGSGSTQSATFYAVCASP